MNFIKQLFWPDTHQDINCLLTEEINHLDELVRQLQHESGHKQRQIEDLQGENRWLKDQLKLARTALLN